MGHRTRHHLLGPRSAERLAGHASLALTGGSLRQSGNASCFVSIAPIVFSIARATATCPVWAPCFLAVLLRLDGLLKNLHGGRPRFHK